MENEQIESFHACAVDQRYAGAQAAELGAVELVRSMNLRLDDFPHTEHKVTVTS
jgi:hypothetical protein